MPEEMKPSRAEKALRASELRYRQLFETTKDDFVSLYPGRASRDVFLSLEEKCGSKYHEAQPRRRDGSLLHAVQNAAMTFDERGEPAQIYGCHMDAGEQRQTEQQLRRADKKKPVFDLQTFLSTPGPGRAIVYVPKKQILFDQGKRGNAVFYILAGAVKLTVVFQGKERSIALLGPGDLAGKECLAAARPPRIASAKALTNCTMVRIQRKEMLRMIQHQRTFSTFFLNYLLARVTRYQELIMDQLFNSSEKRLARTLLLLANFGSAGKPEAIIPNIGQNELAEVVGTTRARVSCFMNRFRKQGLIAYTSHSPVTIRPALLWTFVLAK